MNDHPLPPKKKFRFRIFMTGAVLSLLWLAVISGFLWWEIRVQHESMYELAAVEARASFNKDLVYRRWSAGHGGTYVPATDKTPPNPYLSHLSERDITTPSGKTLTLVNPAYMTRQVHELAENQYAVKTHITSLNPIRPKNKPDEWETKALKAFEKGVKEVQSVSIIDGIEYLRLMRPMVTEKKCLKCHRFQGYKEGDLRGGISVSVPLSAYRLIAKDNNYLLTVVHATIFLIGLIGIFTAFFNLYKKDQKRIWGEQALLNASTESAFLIDAEGTFLVMNDVTAERLGKSLSELIGKCAYNFIPPDIAKTRIKKIKKVFQTGHPVKFVDERAGMILTHHIYPLFNSEGNVSRAAVFTRDVTHEKQTEEALRESEKKFKKMFESAPLSYQALDENGNFIEVNAAWLKALGYKKNEVLGKNFGDFLHPDWRDHFKENFPRFKAVGEVLGVEFEMVKKDGSTILVSFHGKIGKKADGSFRQTHCIFHDVTAQRRIEKEKEILEQKMAQIQKIESIGNLAGGIAHDFNNILFPIIGMSEMLLEDLPPGSTPHKNVQVILKAGSRGSELVKQILAFSRQHEHKMMPVRIQEILKEVIKLCRSTIPSDIIIESLLPKECGEVMADPTQIHQIAMNLITNAYHAVEKTGGKISVRLEEASVSREDYKEKNLEPGRYAVLSVADTGVGISSNHLTKIFEPYFTTKEQGKGTGLGLAVVYGIVKEHKGDIYVQSELDNGSKFDVYLPSIETSAETKSADKSSINRTGNERILLVDDERSIVQLLIQILGRMGYQVTGYTSSLNALKAVKKNPDSFDLVITDMTMPNMTGDRLAREILSVRPGIPIIICTGFSDRISRIKAEEIGIKGFLMKPVIKSEIADMVRKVLDEAKGIN